MCTGIYSVYLKIQEYIAELFRNYFHQYERSSHAAKSIYFVENNSPPGGIPDWDTVLRFCGQCKKISSPEKYSREKNLIGFNVFEYKTKCSKHGVRTIKYRGSYL